MSDRKPSPKFTPPDLDPLIDSHRADQRNTSAMALRAESERFRRKAEKMLLSAFKNRTDDLSVKRRVEDHLLRAEAFKEAAALVERNVL